MSGGAFDYNQYKIGYIADQIEETVVKNGVEKTPEELKEHWIDPDWYKKYPEDKFHYKYPDEVIEKMKEAVKALKIAQVYAQRVDWLLSGDDGEESFLRRLDDELKKLE
jgi:disulfide oxidoreductase YuzD